MKMSLSPELADAIADVQKGHASAAWKRALKTVQDALQDNQQVENMERRRGVLYVTFKSGATLRIEPA